MSTPPELSEFDREMAILDKIERRAKHFLAAHGINGITKPANGSFWMKVFLIVN